MVTKHLKAQLSEKDYATTKQALQRFISWRQAINQSLVHEGLIDAFDWTQLKSIEVDHFIC